MLKQCFAVKLCTLGSVLCTKNFFQPLISSLKTQFPIIKSKSVFSKMHCSLKAFRYKYMLLELDSASLVILRCLLLIKRTYQSSLSNSPFCRKRQPRWRRRRAWRTRIQTKRVPVAPLVPLYTTASMLALTVDTHSSSSWMLFFRDYRAKV